VFKAILTSAALAGLALSAAADNAPDADICETQDLLAQQLQVTTVKVNGMVCDFCARAVTKVFTKNELVDDVDVDLDEGAIIFETRGCLTLDEDTIKEMVHYSGYDFVSIERSSKTAPPTDVVDALD